MITNMTAVIDVEGVFCFEIQTDSLNNDIKRQAIQSNAAIQGLRTNWSPDTNTFTVSGNDWQSVLLFKLETITDLC